jgi:hypothetical protein
MRQSRSGQALFLYISASEFLQWTVLVSVPFMAAPGVIALMTLIQDFGLRPGSAVEWEIVVTGRSICVQFGYCHRPTASP